MNTVIYHSADYDGIFCREIAKKFLPDANLIGWNFGDPKVEMPKVGILYILDLSPDCLSFGPGDELRIVWIDHHKTSIEKWPETWTGYRIDGVAACRLAWQWFSGNHHGSGERYGLPTRDDFLARNTTRIGVSEPLSIRLAGEYDVIGPGANEEALNFQFGLRSTEIAGDEEQLLSIGEFGDRLVAKISERGIAVRGYLDRAELLSAKAAFTISFEGLKFLVTNGTRANSNAFQSVAENTEHDAIMGFFFNGKEWIVSLYQAKHQTDVDLSKIAAKYGGGGHKGACGFTCKSLPFQLQKP